MSVGVCLFCLGSLGYLLQGSWSPRQCQVWVLSIVEWAISQIGYWLVTYTRFIPPLLQHVLQAVHHCRSKGLGLGWCLYFSFSSINKDARMQGQRLCRHQLHHSMFSELYSCFQQQGFSVSLWRAIYNLGSSLGCLKFNMGPLWPTTQVDITQYQYWKLHMVTRNGQLELFLPFLSISFRLPLYMYIFQDSSTVFDFYTTLKYPLVSAVSSHIPFLIFFLPLPCLVLPLQSPHPKSFHNYLFHFHFLGRSICGHHPLLIPYSC